MDVATIALILIVIGLILILIEAVSPGAFIIVPGIVVLVIGIVSYMVPGFMTSIWMPILIIVLFVVVSFITVKLYHRLAPPEPPKTTINTSLIGKRGIVTAQINKNDLKGKVKIDNDTWSANADETIEIGKEVEVVAAEGVHITVKPIE